VAAQGFGCESGNRERARGFVWSRPGDGIAPAVVRVVAAPKNTNLILRLAIFYDFKIDKHLKYLHNSEVLK
jgi:hypothetical protein